MASPIFFEILQLRMRGVNLLLQLRDYCIFWDDFWKKRCVFWHPRHLFLF